VLDDILVVLDDVFRPATTAPTRPAPASKTWRRF
jgi:hypothetical protein